MVVFALPTCESTSLRGVRLSQVNSSQHFGGHMGLKRCHSTNQRKKSSMAVARQQAEHVTLVPSPGPQTPNNLLQTTGPFICIAAGAVIALGAWFSQQRGRRRWRTPGDKEIQLDPLPQSEAELDLAARQLSHAVDLGRPRRLSSGAPLLTWGRSRTGQLVFNRNALTQHQPDNTIPRGTAYEQFQLRLAYYSFLRRSETLKALKAQDQGLPPVVIRLQPMDPDTSNASEDHAAASVDGPSKASIRAKATLRF